MAEVESIGMVAAISAVIATVSAATVAYAGYQQWRLAKRRLEMDLFEKRFGVYESVLELLKEASRKQGWPIDTDREFQRQTEVAKFLFPADIPNWMQQFRRIILDLAEAAENANDTVHEDPTRKGYLKIKKDNLRYVREEFPKLAGRFAPYMSIVSPPYKDRS